MRRARYSSVNFAGIVEMKGAHNMKPVAKARLWGNGIALGMAIVFTVLMVRAVYNWLTPPRKVYSFNSQGIKDGPC